MTAPTALFSDRLFTAAAPVWRACLQHPFVQGIADGTLAQDKFRHYLKQDYVYLVEYCKVFALGAAKSPDLDTMGLFSSLLHGTLHLEMDLHRAYAAEFGIAPLELERTEASAALTGYTSYMLSVAQAGGVENAAAAVLACAWSYNFIGHELARSHPASLRHPFYGKWVQMYSSPEFTALAERCIALVNRLSAGKPEHELQALEDIVRKTSAFEYLFWDMADRLELWPVPCTAGIFGASGAPVVGAAPQGGAPGQGAVQG